MKTNSKEFTTLINKYIINAISSEGYDVEIDTDQEKLQFLADRFKSEYLYPENLKHYGSYNEVLRQWIMGLPSSFNIDFENYKIIEIAIQWGSLNKDSDDKAVDRVLDNWFRLVAFKTIQLFHKYDIDL